MRISDWSSDVCSSDLKPIAWFADMELDIWGSVLQQLGIPGHDRFIADCRPLNADVTNRVNYSGRSEEHTSELQSLMRISYAVFCLKKKIDKIKSTTTQFISCKITRFVCLKKRLLLCVIYS